MYYERKILQSDYTLIKDCFLEFMQEDNSIRIFRLDQYCVSRTMAGEVQEIITEEYLSPEALPENAQSMVAADDYSQNRVPLYTHIKWNVKKQKTD